MEIRKCRHGVELTEPCDECYRGDTPSIEDKWDEFVESCSITGDDRDGLRVIFYSGALAAVRVFGQYEGSEDLWRRQLLGFSQDIQDILEGEA